MASTRNVRQEINETWLQLFEKYNELAAPQKEMSQIVTQANQVHMECQQQLATANAIHALYMNNHEAIKAAFAEEKNIELNLFNASVSLSETQALASLLISKRRRTSLVAIGEQIITEFADLREHALKYTTRIFTTLSAEEKTQLLDLQAVDQLKKSIDKLSSKIAGLFERLVPALPQAKADLATILNTHTATKSNPILVGSTLNNIHDFATHNQTAMEDYQRFAACVEAQIKKYQTANPQRDPQRDISMAIVLSKIDELAQTQHIQPDECFKTLYSTIEAEQAATTIQHYSGLFGKMKRTDSELAKAYQCAMESISSRQKNIAAKNINNNNINNNNNISNENNNTIRL